MTRSPKRSPKRSHSSRALTPKACVGVVQSAQWVHLVTIESLHSILDRRTVALTQGLPTHPYHHEGSWAVGRYANSPWFRPTTLEDAKALIKKVSDMAEQTALSAIQELLRRFPHITAIAIRDWHDLPSSVDERLIHSQLNTQADGVMYRQALANSAMHCGLIVHLYDAPLILEQAQALLPHTLSPDAFKRLGRSLGPPWTAHHQMAIAAAWIALNTAP